MRSDDQALGGAEGSARRRRAGARGALCVHALRQRQAGGDRRDLRPRGRHGVQGHRPGLRGRSGRRGDRVERRAYRHRRRRAHLAPQDLGRRRLHVRRTRPYGGSGRARQARGDLRRQVAARLRRQEMADLTSTFAGIKSPNPFWLASAPPTDKAYNVERAFEAGWGGVVWKTVGEDPPIVNVNGPRYAALLSQDRRVIGFNNIELISDRPLQVNLDEMRRVKRDWPDRAVLASLMVPCTENDWRDILRKVEDTGCDGVELNFGCPHGMSERGMGSAVGQVPEYIEMVARWCKQHTKLPVIVKLTPNIKDLTDGLANFMDAQGYRTIADFHGKAVGTITDWQNLNLNHVEKAVINQDLCIQCGRCHVVCEDTAHQAIATTLNGKRHFEVKDEECVGCNLCVSICPVSDCITMRALKPGEIDTRTGLKATGKYANWTTHPNNPMRKEAEPA